MKIGVLQTNPRVGDVRGNAQEIINLVQNGLKQGVRFFVCPELSLIGYPPKDLMSMTFAYQLQQQCLSEIVSFSEKENFSIVVGVATARKGPGKPFFNSAAFVSNGKLVSLTHKRRLPNYDVFEEERFFEPHIDPTPNSQIQIEGLVFTVAICEDLWNHTQAFGIRDLRSYQPQTNPLHLVNKKADLIIHISASPFWKKKRDTRSDLLKATASKLKTSILMVNQAGANDELIFDGSSQLINAEGDTIFQAPPFESGLFVFDLNKHPALSEQKMFDENELALEGLTLGIRDFVRKTGFSKVHLGLSGGIDSALVAVLAVRALGPQNVVGILLPSKITSRESIDDAQLLARNLGISTVTIPIQDHVKISQDSLEISDSGLSYENLQSRIRGMLLMGYSNKNNSLLLTTGNKSEIAMGYATLYGDMCGALAPIGDLYKTEVYELSRYINVKLGNLIPSSIIEKAPTAELAPNQKDEDSLPPYEILDELLFDILENQGQTRTSLETWNQKLAPKHSVSSLLNKIQKNEFKRSQSAPILKMHLRSFGKAWRFPIASGPWEISK